MYDILIVGGGPAGMTAALYAGRAGKNVCIVEAEGFGGQIARSPLMENYPGLPSISGSAFADHLLDQITALGVEIEVGTVDTVHLDSDTSTLALTTGEGDSFETRALIIATGVTHRSLAVEGSENFVGCGLSYCAVCDGSFSEGKDVAVFGGGNSAVQEALMLADICPQVTLIHRGTDFPRVEQARVDALLARPNISVLHERSIESLLVEDNAFQGVLLSTTDGSHRQELRCSNLFVSIGLTPRNTAFSPLVDLDATGYIIADESCTTKLPNVFAAGDCRTKAVRQVTTACADGTVAALAACRYLDVG